MLPPSNETVGFFEKLHLVFGVITVAVNAVTAYVTIWHSGQASSVYRFVLLVLQGYIFLADFFSCLVAYSIIFLPNPCGFIDGIFYEDFLKIASPTDSFAIYAFLISQAVVMYWACFIYRHHEVNVAASSFRLSRSVRAGIMTLIQVAVMGTSAACLYMDIPAIENKEIVNKIFPLWDETLKSRITCYDTTVATIFVVYVFFIVAFSSAFLALLCGHIFHVLSQAKAMSPQTAAFHRQMTRNLIIQSTIPVSCLAIPTSFLVLQFISDYESTVLSLTSYYIIHSYSIVHCLIQLATTSSYQQALRGIVPFSHFHSQ